MNTNEQLLALQKLLTLVLDNQDVILDYESKVAFDEIVTNAKLAINALALNASEHA